MSHNISSSFVMMTVMLFLDVYRLFRRPEIVTSVYCICFKSYFL